MTDHLSSVDRSRLMAKVRSKNTGPELKVRRLAHAMGYRFRLHRHDLPGSPDLVFAYRSKVVFVHGCFWHRHANCSRASIPKTRTDFWLEKFRRNLARDASNVRDLRAAGWDALVVWECQTADLDRLAEELSRFLGPPNRACCS